MTTTPTTVHNQTEFSAAVAAGDTWIRIDSPTGAPLTPADARP